MSGSENTALSHFDASGRPVLVDVSEKPSTQRRAIAAGDVRMNATALALVKSGRSKKGDAAAVAELAGVMAAKKTADLIPLCHPLALTSVRISTEICEAPSKVSVTATVTAEGATGVEMEALTAVSVACLTLYDMIKSVDRAMTIENIRLLEKSGGASGDFKRAGGT